MSHKAAALAELQPDPEQPFPPEEYDARIARVRSRMAKDGIDLLWVQSPEGINYLTGHQVEWYQAQSPKEWPATSGVAVHVDHDRPILFETEREMLIARYTTHVRDLRIFPPEMLRGGAPWIVEQLTESGWLPARTGLEFWSYRPNRAVSERFQAAFEGAGAVVVDGSDILREVRWIKSEAEMRCIEAAARIAEAGLDAARAAIRPGATELEVYGEAVRAMAAAGGENPGITQPVLAGNKTSSPHAMASRRVMRSGEPVVVDFSGVYKRYHCNLARTFWLGEPPREVRDICARAVGSLDLIRATIRPGLRVGELGAALRAYYREQNLWEDRGWVGGYEMGIAFPPDWVGNFVFDPATEINAERRFDANTVINYENQFFLPDLRGMFFQIDSIAFRPAAAEFLSDWPGGLIVLD
jgi:Xaa-Pro aminopeptidase